MSKSAASSSTLRKRSKSSDMASEASSSTSDTQSCHSSRLSRRSDVSTSDRQSFHSSSMSDVLRGRVQPAQPSVTYASSCPTPPTTNYQSRSQIRPPVSSQTPTAISRLLADYAVSKSQLADYGGSKSQLRPAEHSIATYGNYLLPTNNSDRMSRVYPPQRSHLGQSYGSTFRNLSYSRDRASFHQLQLLPAHSASVPVKSFLMAPNARQSADVLYAQMQSASLTKSARQRQLTDWAYSQLLSPTCRDEFLRMKQLETSPDRDEYPQMQSASLTQSARQRELSDQAYSQLLSPTSCHEFLRMSPTCRDEFLRMKRLKT